MRRNWTTYRYSDGRRGALIQSSNGLLFSEVDWRFDQRCSDNVVQCGAWPNRKKSKILACPG